MKKAIILTSAQEIPPRPLLWGKDPGEISSMNLTAVPAQSSKFVLSGVIAIALLWFGRRKMVESQERAERKAPASLQAQGQRQASSLVRVFAGKIPVFPGLTDGRS